MLIRKVARPLLSAVFIGQGIDSLRNPQRATETARPTAEGLSKLPESAAAKVPQDPETLARITAAVQIGGGVLLASGKLPRLASAALAITVVPGSLGGHLFWLESDPARKAQQRREFLTDLSLIGGLMIAAVDTEGKPSLGWRGRRAARRASAAVSSALPGGADRGHEWADAAAERVSPLLDAARERGGELAVIAKERGGELAEYARERGGEFAEYARDRSGEFADVARTRGADLADYARDRGGDLADTARVRGADLADTARDRGGELAEVARKRAKKTAKKAQKRAKKAQKKTIAQAHVAQKEAAKHAHHAQKEAVKRAQQAQRELRRVG